MNGPGRREQTKIHNDERIQKLERSLGYQNKFNARLKNTETRYDEITQEALATLEQVQVTF
jgi:hypothetical protein